jgi:hypothetical protein
MKNGRFILIITYFFGYSRRVRILIASDDGIEVMKNNFIPYTHSRKEKPG